MPRHYNEYQYARPHRAVCKSTSELGAPHYSELPAGSHGILKILNVSCTGTCTRDGSHAKQL